MLVTLLMICLERKVIIYITHISHVCVCTSIVLLEGRKSYFSVHRSTRQKLNTLSRTSSDMMEYCKIHPFLVRDKMIAILKSESLTITLSMPLLGGYTLTKSDKNNLAWPAGGQRAILSEQLSPNSLRTSSWLMNTLKRLWTPSTDSSSSAQAAPRMTSRNNTDTTMD